MRVPPTEKKGRRQTSTITVAVMDEKVTKNIKINPKDLEIRSCRGSGKGGQHRNVTNSAVQVNHKPSGLWVRCESERSQHLNKELAIQSLIERLHIQEQSQVNKSRKNQRRSQVGSGMRGDKRRTIRVHDGTVTDHITGASTTFSKYKKGILEDLYV